MVNIIISDLRCAVFCMILGFLLKAFYDFVKIFYAINNHKKRTGGIRYVGDTAFFLCGAFSVFQIFLERYNGVFRWYVLFSMGLGALLHKLIICDTFVNCVSSALFYIDSKIVRKAIEFFVQNIKKHKLVRSIYAKLLIFYHRCSKILLRPKPKGRSDEI